MADIEVGNEAILRQYARTDAHTRVDRENPANGTGIITNIEIYTHHLTYDVEVATFYVESGNYLSTRDNETIGNIPQGYSSHKVSLEVNEGDYIGFYFASGSVSYDWTAEHPGVWYKVDDYIPCENQLFTSAAAEIYSIFGISAVAVTKKNVIFMGSNL